jgi:hypothetical protein
MIWSIPDIADAVAAGLRQQAAAEDLEQAVYGLDSRDELGLHPLLGQALRQAGYGVWPEERYPGDRMHPHKSAGRRCDLVLTPGPEALPLRDEQTRGTLFDAQPAVAWDQALWLEVKTVAQFDRGQPFPRYSAELLAPVTQDVAKLWGDEGIGHAALLLVLFTAGREVAEHDLVAWQQRCLDRGYPVRPPAARGFPITERTGNAWCAPAVFGVRGT